MNKTIFNGLEYLEQNYRPSDIQKLLDNSKTKREVYQGLKVSEYYLNKYIKHYNLFFESANTPLNKIRYKP
jgi:hypothetical protein